MYIVSDRKTGEVYARQEQPYYVHVGKNGCFQPCDRTEALAISNHGRLYKLDYVEYNSDLPDGNWAYAVPGDPDSIPVVSVSERPMGEIIGDLTKARDAHTDQIETLEEAACEQVVSTEERLAMLEDALCELAVRMEA